MNILIVNNSRIPVTTYGGTERFMWWLGKALDRLGHSVSFLVAPGSTCPFGRVLEFDASKSLEEQIPDDIDITHLQFPTSEPISKPFVVTIHANVGPMVPLNDNSVFISENHATRYGAGCFIHHGIDPDDYGQPDWSRERRHVHFLGKAAWRAKNVRGAIRIARQSSNELAVLGGYRLNLHMGFRFTLDPRMHFHGMVGGAEKNELMNSSKALVFPVVWNEPFGLAVIESMYFGCPVFATPYGSLPELVKDDVGFLSSSCSALADRLRNVDDYDRKRCHEYVMEGFTSGRMAADYVGIYERVLNGETLNPQTPKLVEIPKAKYLPFEE